LPLEPDAPELPPFPPLVLPAEPALPEVPPLPAPVPAVDPAEPPLPFESSSSPLPHAAKTLSEVLITTRNPRNDRSWRAIGSKYRRTGALRQPGERRRHCRRSQAMA
jgi:hypothetical protein